MVEKENKRDPIGLWLAGNKNESLFGGASVRFKIRREMTRSDGHLQEGMFLVFADETLDILDLRLPENHSTRLNIFALPTTGEDVECFIEYRLEFPIIRAFNSEKELLAIIEYQE